MDKEEFIKRVKQIAGSKYCPISESAGDLWDDIEAEILDSYREGYNDGYEWAQD